MINTELELRITRKAQISFSKRYAVNNGPEQFTLQDFLDDMKFYLDNNPRHKVENLFSVVYDRDRNMCVTLQFDRNLYVNSKYTKGRYIIIGFSDLEEMEEGIVVMNKQEVEDKGKLEEQIGKKLTDSQYRALMTLAHKILEDEKRAFEFRYKNSDETESKEGEEISGSM